MWLKIRVILPLVNDLVRYLPQALEACYWHVGNLGPLPIHSSGPKGWVLVAKFSTSDSPFMLFFLFFFFFAGAIILLFKHP